ncbi:FAD-dependent monooxygenase [Caballeronia sp. S22]|uniref:FAD-dependent monooxygenase n=1 Tax=Caballeronia sp. S22 TaxID=3137182 RepID=UPI003531646E
METATVSGAATSVRHGPVRSSVDVLPQAVDVLLVGCGPIGATIANLLARHGVHVMVVDKSTKAFMASRAIALDSEALRILQLAGIGERDLETVAIAGTPRIRLMPKLGQTSEANLLGGIDGGSERVTLCQSELERCLRTRLRRYERAHVALGVGLARFTQDRDRVVATLDLGHGRTHVLCARYLVGADGANSLVKALLTGKTLAKSQPDVDTRVASRRIDYVERIGDPRQTSRYVAVPDQVCSFESLASLDDSADATIRRSAVDRFNERSGDGLCEGRVFLAGDAANITYPSLGTELVEGLRDAANLSWKLAWVIQGRADSRILDTYEQERRPREGATIKLTRFIEKLVMPRNSGIALLPHWLMQLSRVKSRLCTAIDGLQTEPKSALKKGLYVKGRSPTKLVRGAVIAQGRIRGSDGKTCLSDDVLGQGLVLLGFGTDARGSLDRAAAAAFVRAGGSYVQIARRGLRRHLSRHESWEDLDDAFFARLPLGWAAVVRPDRTVIHDGPATDASRLVRESLSLLGQHCWVLH